MLDLGTLQAHIKLEGAEEVKDELKSVGEEAEKTDKTFQEKLAESAVKIAGGFGLLASAAKDVGGWFKGLMDDTASYGDEVDKQSQKMSVSAEEYQKWDYVLQRNGSSIDVLQKGMKTLTGKMESGSDAFEALGVSVTNSDGSMRSAEEVMNDTMMALAGMEDGAERSALASELFGSKVAQELNPTLNSGAQGITDLKDRADELGLVMSDEGVKASANYQDAMLDLQESLSGVKNEVGQSLLPIITDLVNAFTNDIMPALKDMLPAIGGVVSALVAFKVALGISSIISGVVGAYQAFATANEGATIAQWLLNAAMNANPFVLIATLVAGLVTALVLLWNTNDGFREACISAWETVKGAVSGVVEALVTFFTQTIPSGLQTAINWFSNLPGNILSAIGSLASTLVSKAGELINGFKNGITNTWSNVTSWLSGIGGKVVSAVGGLGSTLYSAGSSIISGFLSGITAKFESVKSFVSGIGSWIANHKGPKDYDLALLVPNGGWIMDGLVTGLENAKPELQSTLKGIADTISQTQFSTSASLNVDSGASGLSLATAGTNYNIYINGTRINDDAQIENKFGELLKMMARKGMM